MREGSRGRIARFIGFLMPGVLVSAFVPALLAADLSPREDREIVTKRDRQGRTLLSRFSDWVILHRRDDAGNVISKTWTHLRRNDVSLVRCFTYDKDGRKVMESDPAGRNRHITYAADGSVFQTLSEEGFLEEAHQLPWMNTLLRPLREGRMFRFEYDPSRRLK